MKINLYILNNFCIFVMPCEGNMQMLYNFFVYKYNGSQNHKDCITAIKKPSQVMILWAFFINILARYNMKTLQLRNANTNLHPVLLLGRSLNIHRQLISNVIDGLINESDDYEDIKDLIIALNYLKEKINGTSE